MTAVMVICIFIADKSEKSCIAYIFVIDINAVHSVTVSVKGADICHCRRADRRPRIQAECRFAVVKCAEGRAFQPRSEMKAFSAFRNGYFARFRVIGKGNARIQIDILRKARIDRVCIRCSPVYIGRKPIKILRAVQKIITVCILRRRFRRLTVRCCQNRQQRCRYEENKAKGQ